MWATWTSPTCSRPTHCNAKIIAPPQTNLLPSKNAFSQLPRPTNVESVRKVQCCRKPLEPGLSLKNLETTVTESTSTANSAPTVHLLQRAHIFIEPMAKTNTQTPKKEKSGVLGCVRFVPSEASHNQHVRVYTPGCLASRKQVVPRHLFVAAII